MTEAETESARQNGGSTRPDLVDLELVVEVARSGSITHGAKSVHLSLPAASARIRALERVLGVEVFERGRRGVSPTPAGHLLLRHARTVLHQVGRLRDDMDDYTGALITTVRLVVNPSAFSTVLAPQLIGFLAEHRDTSLDVTEMSSRQAVREVSDGRAELGVVAETANLSGLEHFVIDDLEMVLVVALDSPLRDRDQVTLADCLSEPFIGLTGGRTLAQHHDSADDTNTPGPRYRIRVPTTALVCDAVAAGVGVSILPASAVVGRTGDSAAEGAVCTVALDEPWARRRTVLCYRPQPTLSPAAGRLVRSLQGTDHPSRSCDRGAATRDPTETPEPSE